MEIEVSLTKSQGPWFSIEEILNKTIRDELKKSEEVCRENYLTLFAQFHAALSVH